MKTKLDICKQTRQIAIDTLEKTLNDVLKKEGKVSEVMFRDMWLDELRKHKTIFPDGWYMPPPHGIIILFANDNNVKRLNFKSARGDEYWPKEDVYLNLTNGLMYCYASSVDKKTGIIGDFGMSLYFGSDSEMKTLLKTCLKIDSDIFNYLQIGQTFSQVSLFTERLLNQQGMINEAVGLTDKGDMIVGHTIPDAFKDWSKKEKIISQNDRKDWGSIKDIISKKRVNIKKGESLMIKPGSAFTVEVRPTIVANPYLPESLSYHTIALFDQDGNKELLTGFDKIFKIVGMDYMLN